MGPVELIIATFEHDENKAGEVLETVKQLAAEKILALKAAAVIVKTKAGEIQVKDLGDVDSKQGKVFGAISGALIGLLGGPVGAVVGGVAGAATGKVAAKVIDRGVSNKMIDDIKKGLHPGSSAVIVYAELSWVERAVSALKNEGAVVHHETIGEQLISGFVTDLGNRLED